MSELERLSAPLPYLYGSPSVSGVIRQSVEDFIVEEDLGFEPDGEGHHVLLFIEKRDTNTQWLAKQLARYAELPVMEVGYAGLKDRHAITRQWFSVHLAGRDIDWQAFNSEHWNILNITRHQKKLRPGYLRGNHFQIVVRDLEGNLETLNPRLEMIKQHGFSNYFGEQRFGFDNLKRAYAWLSGELKIKKKSEKSLLLSSLRSALFNQLLARRIEQGSWNTPLEGDVMMLSGSHSVFSPTRIDEDIKQRLAERDIVLTAPLYGKGKNLAHSHALTMENDFFEQFPDVCQRLRQAGMTAGRRTISVIPAGLSWQLNSSARTLQLSFSLTAGSYATCLLRDAVRTERSK